MEDPPPNRKSRVADRAKRPEASEQAKQAPIGFGMVKSKRKSVPADFDVAILVSKPT